MKTFSSHIKTKHENNKKNRPQMFFCCDITNCNKKWIESLQTLLIHFYTHLGNETQLSWIFKNCNYKSSSKDYYRIHFSREHTNKSYKKLRDAYLSNNNILIEQFDSDDIKMDSYQETHIVPSGISKSQSTTVQSMKNTSQTSITEKMYEFYNTSY
ncbi:unnamed protein product [Brachionus calyciflorus]|uniref:Uncharacterized protein n=1 Tax=Brachionus calyciflorus TaxID=104777 RepID=A0A814JWU6_9BILA|nr:unnamed protein product [Brachionus calyciflorus]